MKPDSTKTRCLWPLVATVALLMVLLAPPAQAVTKTWVGPKGNTLWTNANNWSPTGQPVAGDDVNLTSTTNKTAFFDAPVNPALGFLTVDAGGGSTFTLFQPGNALSAGTEIVGDSGKGQVVQTGGANNNKNLTLGLNLGSSGTYTLSGSGSLSTSTDQAIGLNGTGLFNQSGGNNTVTTTLILGANLGGSGTYNMNGGHLQANDEFVGASGTGTFNQGPNSTNIVSNILSLGFSSGSGTYNMKGGYLQTFDDFVGDDGKGTFNQSGGTHQISSILFVGSGSTASGTFNLQAGNLSAQFEFIGDLGTGKFTQSAGTHTVSDTLVLGFSSKANGTYNLNSGSLSAKADEVIGANGTGSFTQTGGTHTVSNFLVLGNNATGNGTYNLIKGNLQVKNERIGNDGLGTFNQIGGTHTVTNALTLAAGAGSGTYNLQGGTLSAGAIDINPAGTFNVKNTTTTVNAPNVNNFGTVKTTNANVTWNGFFSNSGAYISDPSTQTFNYSLGVTPTGYLVGGSQDLFIIKNDFRNFSTLGAQWNTVLSSLKFITGADNSHDFLIAGQGATPVNNFAWYSLDITGQVLHLKDSNGGGSGDQWLQVLKGATFTGTTLTNIFNDDGSDVLNLYYDKNLATNAYLGGKNYTITGGAGGMLIAHTPVPPSVLLLGSGLLGLGALGWRRKRG